VDELESLVKRAGSGDLDAFGEIVTRFQDMACGCAYAVLGDFHLDQDAAQEAFLQAYRSLPKLAEPRAFPRWFHEIVLRSCNRLTRRKRLPTAAIEAAGEIETHAPGPAAAAEHREMRNTVIHAIKALPDSQRMVTTLYYINGYSQKDIADFLQLPVTTVNNRLHASRKRLKERMIAMVAKTLKEHAPDQGFCKAVMAKLVRERKSLNEGLGGFPALEGARVRLREIRPREDAENWLAVRSTESGEVDFKDASLDQLVKQFEGVRSRFYDQKYVIYWAITLKDDDRMIGNVRYWEYMGHYNSPWAFGTIQYELARQYGHKGIAPEALRLAAEFGLTRLGFARVQCSINSEDKMRARELEEAGFTREGLLRCWWYDNASRQWQDELMFSLVKSDLSK
jgi:RNA polymerase sigma factor (sigma-70 family)